MLIAVPVKFNKEDSPVSPLFGHAKWFAFVKDNNIEIKKNIYKSGMDVIQWFISEGVDVLIVKEIGITPYNVLKNFENIKIFYAGDGRIELLDLLDKFHNNQLQMMDDTTIHTILHQH